MLSFAATFPCADYRPPTTATVVARLLAEGGWLAGSTNMDEFGMGSATAFSHHGPSYNPYSANWALRSLGLLPNGNLDKGGVVPEAGWLCPGGSSGGAAVSVATGSALAAIGSDTGGSVRQPASFCGLVGLKPTYGRIPRWGLIPYASSLDTIGIITRTVADAALLLQVTAGHDPRDDTCLRPPSSSASTSDRCTPSSGISDRDSVSSKPLAGIRVGIPAEYRVSELNADTLTWWGRGAAMLADAGAEIVEVSLPNTAAALPAYYVIAPAEAASNLSRYDGVRYGFRPAAKSQAEGAAASQSSYSSSAATANASDALHRLYTRTRSEGFGPEVQRRIMTGNFVLSQEARADYYDAAVAVRDRVRADFARVFRPSSDVALPIESSPIARSNPAAYPSADAALGVDVLLTPVSPTPPWLSSKTAELDPLAVYVNDVMTIPASLAHLPAISVPVGHSSYPSDLIDLSLSNITDAAQRSAARLQLQQICMLPVGLQLIGRHCDEETLFRVASVLAVKADFNLPAYVTGDA